MKKFLFLIASSFLILSCSRESDSPAPTPTPTPVPVPVPTPSDALTTQNVKTYMVDKNASSQTVALFYNLKKLSKTKTIIGHQDAFNAFYANSSGNSDIKKSTGNDPGLLGSDFMFITDKNNDGSASNWFYQQEQKIIQDTKLAYSKGMINIFCWHLREPNNENSFYASDMTAEQKNTAFKGLLPGGIHHNWYKTKLDKIASVVSNLKDNNGNLIPIIFRPFHEFDGNWFWWGQSFSTDEEYKSVYRFTVEYLRDTKNVHNILFSFSPDNSYSNSSSYLRRYPGDAYVDVLGMDNYGDLALNQGSSGATKANDKLKMISDLAIQKVKIAAFTETGYQVTSSISPINGWFSNFLHSAITNNNPEIAFVMFWNNSQNAYYVPTPSHTNVQDFKDFAIKSRYLLQNNLPNLYVLP